MLFLVSYVVNEVTKKFQCRYRNKTENTCSGRGERNQDRSTQGYTKNKNENWRGQNSNMYGRNKFQNWSRESYTATAENKDEDAKVVFIAETGSGEPFENSYLAENSLKWCVDSGCSDHLVSDLNVFSDYHEFKIPKKISVAKGGVYLEAKGIGNIDAVSFVKNVKVSCQIKNVYYCPDVKKNLMSVSKLENNGLTVTFAHNEVKATIKDRVVMIGKKEGSLYLVNMRVENSANYSIHNSLNYKDNLIDLWHRRLGHLGIQNLKQLGKSHLVEGMGKLSVLDNTNFEKLSCEPCIMGKMTRQPFNGKGYRANKPLEVVHTDVCGPISPTTWDGFRYFVTFLDDYTHMVVVYLLKNKFEVFEKFKEYHAYARHHFGVNILNLRLDNGGEYTSNEMRNFCKDQGIRMKFIVPYNPEMNGKAERLNRTLVEKARTLLIDSELPKDMWGEAIYTSAYLTNRSPTTNIDKTPIEMWEGRRPNLEKLRVFGSIAYKHVPDQLRTKLENKAKKLIMVGYGPNSSYRLWDPERRKIEMGRNVMFDENKLNTPDTLEIEKLKYNKEIVTGKGIIVEDIQEEVNIQEEENNQMDQERTTPTKRNRNKPKWHNDYITDFETEEEAMFAYLLENTNDDVPKNMDEIDQRPDREKWTRAIKAEIDVLEESKTWIQVKKPENIKTIDTKWVFSRKEGKDKEQIYKARLVVRGFQQKDKIEDTYAPVLRLQTLRIVLAIAIQRNYDIHQMDVKGAFLYGRIDEHVYLNPPRGVNVEKGLVLKLTKSLYGLKKSPKYWYDRFHELITEIGFSRSDNDYCLYIKANLYILIYVDDLLIVGNSDQEIAELKMFLCAEFRMKDMGTNSLIYLGISILKLKDDILLDQSSYLKKVLVKYGMEDCKPIDTPMEVNFKIISKECLIDYTLELRCRSLIGSLMYVTVGTRPDLATAVYYLSRFQSKPCKELWMALKRVLRYIKGTLNLKLKYSKTNDCSILIGYADSDWARDEDRKSTSGYLFKIYNNSVIWRSKKQTCIALSTAEAELVSLCEAVKEMIWIIKLLKDFNLNVDQVTVFEDNQSTIKSAKNPDQKSMKHLEKWFS